MTNQVQTQQTPDSLIGKLATIPVRPTLKMPLIITEVRHNIYGHTQIKVAPPSRPDLGSAWMRLESVTMEPEQV